MNNVRCPRIWKGFISFLIFVGASLWGHSQVYSSAQLERIRECNGCHGINGNSSNEKWPNLAGQRTYYIEKQLRDFKSGARTDPYMTPMAQPLSDEDIKMLATYYASQTAMRGMVSKDVRQLVRTAAGEDKQLEGSFSQSETQEASQDQQQAKLLFTKGNPERGIPACSTCHGPNGFGLESMKTPRLSGQRADYLKAQILAFRAGRRTNDMGQMSASVKNLKYSEIKLLTRFLETWDPQDKEEAN